jgi:hypothetical protein
MPQEVRAIYLDEVRFHSPENLLDVSITGENPMVRIVKKSGAFNGIQRGAKQRLCGVLYPRHNDGMVLYPTVISERPRLFQQIGVHAAGAAIDIQGGEITDTHYPVLVSRLSIPQVPSLT